MLNDGVHLYTYDQEGNLVYVDNGTTTWDNYDALNRRIMHVTGNYSNYLRYEYGIDGKLAGVWQNEELYEKLNRYYGPKGDSFSYWTGGTNLSNEVVHYQHTDYLGTVKIRTDQNHNVEGSYSNFPFGEQNSSGTDDNTEHYATLDRDSESDTHHAQFRTYEPRIGRWLQPDPYDGSYDYASPQSLNRYSYVANNPLGYLDPQGTEYFCVDTSQLSTPIWFCEWEGGGGGAIPWYCQEYGGCSKQPNQGSGSGTSAQPPPPSQTTPTKPTTIKGVGTCLAQAASNGRGLALAADIVGDVATGVALANPASTAAIVVGVVATSVGTINAIVQNPSVRDASVATGNQTVSSTGVLTHGLEVGSFIKTGTKFSQAVTGFGILGSIVSTVTDANTAISAYTSCRSGKS